VKITHELRASQRRAILIRRQDAAGRLAMFLMMMREHPQAHAGNGEIPLPMSRTDIADFLGLSPGAVSRAANRLQRQGSVRFEGRHLARVVDRILLAKVAAG
jgi:CRP/FNR family transcriptional regulator